MISSLTALLIIFAAVIGSTAMVGIIAYFAHRLRQLEAKAGGEAGSDHLGERVEALQEELLAAQHEIAALTERVDFTEKLLGSGGDKGAWEDPQS